MKHLTISAALIFSLSAAATEIEVTDGDTIIIDGTRHRLYGIDAPEKDQPHGQEATLALGAILHDINIHGGAHTHDYGKDQYRRRITLITYKDQSAGTSAQAAMIAEGHAWVYWKYCKIPACEAWGELEIMAIENRRGLWADPEPVAPWDWRKKR